MVGKEHSQDLCSFHIKFKFKGIEVLLSVYLLPYQIPIQYLTQTCIMTVSFPFPFPDHTNLLFCIMNKTPLFLFLFSQIHFYVLYMKGNYSLVSGVLKLSSFPWTHNTLGVVGFSQATTPYRFLFYKILIFCYLSSRTLMNYRLQPVAKPIQEILWLFTLFQS